LAFTKPVNDKEKEKKQQVNPALRLPAELYVQLNIKNMFMKRLMIFFTVVWGSTVLAQTTTYHPFPDSNAIWNIYSLLYGIGYYEEFYTIMISGDTVINSSNYHKLNIPYIQTSGKSGELKNSLGYNGAIREDEVNRKIYFVPPQENTEQLLYDFTLQVGDTVSGYIETYAYPKDVVYSIDSVLVGDNYRKRWNINLSYGISLVEGMGSTYGLIEKSPGQIVDAPDISITCFKQNGNTLYPDTTTNCDIITSLKSPIKDADLIKIYPNPSNGSINIELDQSLKVKGLKITDMIGNIMLQRERDFSGNLDVNLPAGIFLLSLTTNENKNIIKKILSCP
jgi:hypothetical protein